MPAALKVDRLNTIPSEFKTSPTNPIDQESFTSVKSVSKLSRLISASTLLPAAKFYVGLTSSVASFSSSKSESYSSHMSHSFYTLDHIGTFCNSSDALLSSIMPKPLSLSISTFV